MSTVGLAEPVRAWRVGICAVLCLAAMSCGDSNTSKGVTNPSASNVVSVVVDAGPTSTSPDVNTLFTTVTVCIPGNTTTCQTIDHIQVDTASYGLRILAPVLTLSLPVQTIGTGESLLECTQFVDGYSWGPVATADVQIGGEAAASVPIQVIGATNFLSLVPANCSSIGPAEDTVAAFGANGVLGVGVFAQDCGAGCVNSAANGFYYACTSTQCTGTTLVLASQVPNPVTLFAKDNNGVIIQLPTVAAGGAATVTGSLFFGVDTQTNNKSGSQAVLNVDPTQGYLTTMFNGMTLTQSFLDTGSNGLYFNDSSITACTSSNFTGFYCPASTLNFTATLQGVNGVSANASFSVDDAQNLGAGLVAFATLAGTFPSDPATFDWGLPFYYGRTVYTVIESAVTSVGMGPYVAF
jgi:hypothetical protein